MTRVIVAALFAVGCSGSASVVPDAGAAPEGGADGGQTCFAESNAPDTPCLTDSDCHNAFLVCVRSTVSACRDVDSPTPDAGCLPPAFADAPICPTMAEVAIGLCSVRYQLSCVSNEDCGPGFVCTNGMCDGSGREVVCTAETDCPAGWDCYEACACPGASPAPKRCYPPFSRFGCPACRPIMDPTDAAVTAD